MVSVSITSGTDGKQIIADVIDNQFYEADCYIRGTNLVAKYNYCFNKQGKYTGK